MTEGPIFEITKAARFDAAHRLPGGEGKPYERLHGHTYRVEASVAGPASAPMGWVADLASLETALAGTAGELDHSLLNDHPGLEAPTLEALCLWFAQRLGPRFPGLVRVTVSRPTVDESCTLNLRSGPRASVG